MSIFFDDLVKLKDEENRLFIKQLVPNIELDSILGANVPKIRILARKLLVDRADDVEEFLQDLPHKYLEENILHSFFICEMEDFNLTLAFVDKFLPYVDNWAICDSFRPWSFSKNIALLPPKIEEWISSTHVYTVRFGIGLFLKYFLNDFFKVEYLERVAKIESEEYYINMMIAWFFAEALVRQKDATLPFIKEHRLSKWIHNKVIQKACDSRRIELSFKLELKELKLK